MKDLEQTVEVAGLNDLTDEELARHAAPGSHPCYETLVCRYSSRLFQFLRTRLSSDQDAEDLTQDTFIKAFQNIHRFDWERKFSTWLYTIASRLAIDYYRTQGRKDNKMNRRTGDKDIDLPDDKVYHNPQENLLMVEDSRNLWTMARALKPDQYEALWLRYAEELSVQEIADVMKKKQISVRVLLHRARTKLSDLLRQCEPLPGDNDESSGASAPLLSF